MFPILRIICGAFYGLLCVFSIVTGLQYASGRKELNPLELSDRFMSRYADPEKRKAFARRMGWVTFVVGIVQGVAAFAIIKAGRPVFYWIALGFTLFSIASAAYRLMGRRSAFPALKCAAYLAILIVLLLGGTRDMFFGKAQPAGAAALAFHSFDGGGPAYTVVMDSDIVSYTSVRRYKKWNHKKLNGAGYDVIFTFVGLKPGKADMTVEEHSPIGGDQDHYYTVSVDPDLKVSIEEAEGRTLTADLAFRGVSAYCHEAYDWSAAKDDPEIMYVTMGEETGSEYQVIFRSYTGAFVDFHVDKASGETRMMERVPDLGIEEEAGSINIYDYLG